VAEPARATDADAAPHFAERPTEPIVRDGLVLAGSLAAAAAAGGLLAGPWLGGSLFALALFTLAFFRNPARAIPGDERTVVAPADGRVLEAGEITRPDGSRAKRVGIFLSIFDVHVNRAPIGGRIAAVDYRAGAFLPAFDHEASLRNEQNSVTIEDGGTRVVFKQIAGLIARRIVFRKKVDDRVAPGERVGLIKFGSRVDVFLPPNVAVRVKVGDRVAGGTSVLGELP